MLIIFLKSLLYVRGKPLTNPITSIKGITSIKIYYWGYIRYKDVLNTTIEEYNCFKE